MTARLTTLLFAVSLFASAFLLFALEPLITRFILPLLGGSASVWNTALLFFQTTLFAGYLYAFALSRAKPRTQLIIHAIVLAVALGFLPPAIGADWIPGQATSPIVFLLAAFAAAIGLPFLALAATAPLVQRWYALTGNPGARDPYFLYAASNVGSMAALVCYPVLIEPGMGLGLQAATWSVGFLLAAALVVACGTRAIFGNSADTRGKKLLRSSADEPSAHIRWGLRLRWLAWSFVPSAMLLAVTLHISVDVASVPFLWVAPLALYLLSYAIAFARRTWLKPAWALAFQAWLTIGVAIYFSAPDLWLILGLHVGILFATGLVCHQALAASRPSAAHVTEFYLWNSAGGWLGGVFGALVAPLVFNSILEYPILLVAACFLRPPTAEPGTARSRVLDVALPATLGVYFLLPFWVSWANPVVLGAAGPLLYYAVLVIALNWFRHRPIRFGLAVGLVVLGAQAATMANDNVLGRWRSFYGVYEVSDTADGRVRLLQHGTTIHGAQARDPRYARLPLTYYNREGPLGRAVAALSRSRPLANVAAVGLGVGTIACYFDTGQNLTFFEIDPLVERIASDPKLFTYLSDCGRDARIEIGDGRLGLAAAPDGHFDLIILDAFTSDAIPVHLLTREALRIYLAKLTPAGVLLIHISNKYVELAPVLGAAASSLKLTALEYLYSPTPRELDRGGYASDWIVMAEKPDSLAEIRTDQGWQPIRTGGRDALWTDDYSNVFRALKWDQLLWARRRD